MTRQRQLILEIIHKTEMHLTAEEIYDAALRRFPGMSRATVYNNLHALEADSMIRRIVLDDGKARYDRGSSHNAHLVCRVCGGLADLALPKLDSLLFDALDGGYDSYELRVYHVCSACRTRSKSEGDAE